MALTPAEKQRRYRERQSAMAQANSDALEQKLMLEAERADRGELSDQERWDLADRMTDFAMELQHRATRISQRAFRVRTGEDHPRRSE
jgi:hypothetical protein